MPKLRYSFLVSLDGYIEDEQGNFDWAAPGEDVHALVNEVERDVGTFLFGRRMYETMTAWESPEMRTDENAVVRDFAELWHAADKVVYSTTLPDVTTARTRLERTFDPAAVARLKAESPRDVAISGPALAAQAFAVDLVDVVSLFVFPVLVGGGKPVFPPGVHLPLELTDERRFADGTVYVSYAVVR